jgi:hypothetical protein
MANVFYHCNEHGNAGNLSNDWEFAGSLRKAHFHGDMTLTEKEKRMGEIFDNYKDE